MGRRRMEEDVFGRISSGLIDFLSNRSINPTSLTVSAFILALISSAIYAVAGLNPNYYILAGLILAASGLLDALDGALARKLRRVSKTGAFLDSVFDKAGESMVLVAITSSGAVDVFWGSLAIAASILVSYVRHRAEPLGVDLKGVGFMERAERIILLTAASFLMPFIRDSLRISVILIAIFALVTVAWRIIYVVQRLRR